jgi:FMN phosphatase YigB (HAD superfamily)
VFWSQSTLRKDNTTMLSKLFCFGSKSKDTPSEKSSPVQVKTQRSSTTTTPSPPNGQLPVAKIEKCADQSKNRTLILDLGDVLFHYSARELTALTPTDFKSIVLTPAWSEFESGRLTEDEAFKAIGKELSLDPASIHEGFAQCRKTLYHDDKMYTELKALKEEMGGLLKVYAMTNISKKDFVRLKDIVPSWDLFDDEFTSFDAGMVKPELGFFQKVIDRVGLTDPASAIFVDDKLVNIIAARSFGIRGIVFEEPKALMRQLRNELLDPVTRARQYMKTNARNHISQIEGGAEFPDNFSQFLIHKVLKDPSLLNLSAPGSSEAKIEEDIELAGREATTWNYFRGPPIGSTTIFPDDVDDTAIAIVAFSPPASSANILLDRFLANRHPTDGLVLTYFDESRPRVDPIVEVNVVRFFYHYKRGTDVQHELKYVRNVLLNRAYIDGTPAYNTSDPFLFFLSCLIHDNPDAAELRSLQGPIAAALRERVGQRNDSFAVATRVLACQTMGVWADPDIAYLKTLQDSDGGWEMGWVCRYGRTKKRIGSRGVPTAYAIKALEHDAEHS